MALETAGLLAVSSVVFSAVLLVLLIRAKRQLRNAQQRIKEPIYQDGFIAAVSHELRAPLTAILGAVYILRNKRGDQLVFSRALDLIERSANAQAKIIDNLSDASEILNGKLQIKRELVDLKSVIHSAIDTVRPHSEAKRIQLEARLDSLVHAPHGDSNRLQQVVWNLLTNSLKFTPQGGSITVELVDAETHAELRVRDTGIGIGPDLMPYLFQPREKTSRSRFQTGPGLGLSIVRHLVESHGGSVRAESLGHEKGSTFIVQLPLNAGHPAAKSAQAAK
jgi:signal transduction histidine kinase